MDPPSSLPFYLVSSYSLVQLSNIAHVNMVLGLDTVLGLEQPYVQFENAENVGKISQNLAGEKDDIK